MLRVSPSLKVRAAATFIGIYVAIFVALLLLMSAGGTLGARHRVAPSVVLSFAAEELVWTERGPGIPEDGRMARLRDRNPSLWVLGRAGPQDFSFGRAPPQAVALFDDYAPVIDNGRFHVPGVAPPQSDAAMRREILNSRTVVLAGGGIDPKTISFSDSFHYFFLSPDLFPLFLLGAVGLAAMLCALPLLTSALKRVAADAAAIVPEYPDRRIGEAGVPTELLPLVRRFNAALDRLSDELVRRKHFVADVAHELRTPLAIASLQVDGLKAEEGTKDLRRVITRMSQLVGQMLDVERLSLARRHEAEIDLTALARDVVADMAPMALASGYELSLEAPSGPVIVEGDASSLGRAIANLVGNAVAHGRGEGQVQVLVSAQRTLDVVDDGPGVPLAIWDTLFEPFCREPWDRDGCGLGLHLTREIMRAHGGDAILLPTTSGAHFRLCFPA